MNQLATRLKQTRIELSVYATVLVAFFFRAYRLADSNVWWDEGWSIWLAKQDWIAIALRTASDEHPPLHYWMLKAWSAFAGFDAFSARFLSVAFGVITVALLYRIGKRVGGARIGLLAAVILALARFHIWWSQDIKNYTPSIFFAFAAVWFVLDSRWLRADGKLPNSRHSRFAIPYSLCAYALFTALALWTHYLAALIVLAVNVYALVVFAARFSLRLRVSASPRRDAPPPPRSLAPLLPWLFANALAFALFAPWLYLYLTNAAAWSAAPAFDFGLFVKLAATVLPLGVTTGIENYAGATIAFTTLALLGSLVVLGNSKFKTHAPYVTVAEQRHSHAGVLNSSSSLRFTNCEFRILLFVIIVLLPPLLLYTLSLTPVSFFAPKIQARYLLILLPAYSILVALGIAALASFSRAFAFFAILFVLFASAFVLRDYYADRRLRDEYATLANTINAFARQGDVVLLDTDQEWPTFLYYLRAPLDWLGASNGKPIDAATADALVQRALVRNRAVWLVALPDALATDPRHLLETRLARELPKTTEWTFDDKRVVLYARDARDLAQVAPANLNIQHPLSFIPFPKPGNPNELIAQLTGFDLPVREARAGDTLRITTYWHAVATRGELLLADPRGQLARTTPLELATGKDVRVVSQVQIPPDAASGEFAARVKIADTTFELARVQVESRGEIARADRIANPLDIRFGDAIHLLGYDLPQKKLRAGAQLPMTIYWKADRGVEKSYVVFVHLLGAQFNALQNNFLWGQVDRVPALPTYAWRVGEIVPDAYRVAIDANAPAGMYKIEIGMYDPATGARLMRVDGSDAVIVAEVEIE